MCVLLFCLLRQCQGISSFIFLTRISFSHSRPWSRQYISNDMIVNTSYTVSIITFVYFETTNNMLIIAHDVIHRPLRYHTIFGANISIRKVASFLIFPHIFKICCCPSNITEIVPSIMQHNKFRRRNALLRSAGMQN